jgi:hypothetical protein
MHDRQLAAGLVGAIITRRCSSNLQEATSVEWALTVMTESPSTAATWHPNGRGSFVRRSTDRPRTVAGPPE